MPEHPTRDIGRCLVQAVRQRAGRASERRGRRRRLLDEGTGAIMGLQQRPHFAGEHGVAPGLRVDERRAISGGKLERAMEQVCDARPLGRGIGTAHVASAAPSSSRSSQARASVQWRFTVAGEMSMASAVSSTESPPK